ncbi:MAG: hypothetical protein ACYC05_07870 [Sulfuricella sp.]|nr:hypothetical protein [Gammaproteobacteria bacterium]
MMEETLIKALQADVPAAFLFVGDEANLLREPPIYSSHRRKPVSSALNFLDSGLRRNDDLLFNQRFLSALKGIFAPFFTTKPIGNGTRFGIKLPIGREKSA